MRALIAGTLLLLAATTAADASHRGTKPNLIDCQVPGFDDHTGFAIFNPDVAPGIPGPPLFDLLFVKSRTRILGQDPTTGALTLYTPMGDGYCTSVTDPETGEPFRQMKVTDDAVSCEVPGLPDIEIFTGVNIRASESAGAKGVDGSLSKYFTFGAGYCLAIRFAD